MDPTAVWFKGVANVKLVIDYVESLRTIKYPCDGDIMIWFDRKYDDNQGGHYHMAIDYRGRCYFKDGLGEGGKVRYGQTKEVDEYNRERFTHFKRVRPFQFPIAPSIKEKHTANYTLTRHVVMKVNWALRRGRYKGILKYFEEMDNYMVNNNIYIPKGEVRERTDFEKVDGVAA